MIKIIFLMLLTNAASAASHRYAMLSSSGAAIVENVSIADDSWKPTAGWVEVTGVDKGDYYDGATFFKRTIAKLASGVDPSTSTAKGDTLILNIDGDGDQIVTFGNNDTGDEVAADIANQVRKMTAKDPKRQEAYTNFSAGWNGAYRLYSPANQGRSVAVTGGTAAAALKLDKNSGAIEFKGVGATW